MHSSTRQGLPKQEHGTVRHLDALLDILAEELVERFLAEESVEDVEAEHREVRDTTGESKKCSR
jgi:hypothetical protein